MTEVLIGFVLLGGLTFGAVQAIRESDNYRARIQRKTRLLGLRSRFRKLMGSSVYVREVFLKETANRGLEACVMSSQKGCEGQGLESADFALERGLPPIKMSYRGIAGNLIEVQMTLESQEPPFNGFQAKVFLLRSEHWPLKPPRDDYEKKRLLDCAGRGRLAGVDTFARTAICRRP
jgi:hypothetical protein